MENYLIYNKLVEDLNKAPFEATLSLFDKLNIAHELCNTKLSDKGYEFYPYDKVGFSKIFEPLFDENKTIVSLENSSHLGILKSKEILNSTCEVLSFAQILRQNSENISSKIVHTFEKFNTCIYLGCNEKDLKKDDISYLLSLTKAKEINLQSIHDPDGYNLLKFDKQMAYKMAGKIIFEAYDNGCDFLIVNDIRTFNLFDMYQKDIQKRIKRPLCDGGFGIFTISQILLMALGYVKLEENFTNTHEVKPNFL